MDWTAAGTFAVIVIAALTAGIVKVVKEIRTVHAIVNQQRTDMAAEIVKLKQAVIDRDDAEHRALTQAAVETAKRLLREAAEDAAELVRQAAKDVLQKKQP